MGPCQGSDGSSILLHCSMSCEKHKKVVEKYDGDLQGLATDIGDLHYEALSELLEHLKIKLNIDGNKDHQGGRKKLALALYRAAEAIEEAEKHISEAWRISKPFMK